MLKEKTLNRKVIYTGKVLTLLKDEVELPNGKNASREYCLHIGAVCVIPVLSDKSVIVERQYRHAHGRIFLEIPAGKLNYKDEDPLEAAKRELLEETGAVANKYTFLGEIDTSPALLSEKIYMFLAEDISFKEQNLDEDEFLEVEKIHIDKLVDMTMEGKIKDSKTQIAVLKAKRILDSRT